MTKPFRAEEFSCGYGLFVEKFEIDGRISECTIYGTPVT